MTFKAFSKRTAVAAIFAGTLLVASVATAAWLASGEGNGYAKAGTAVDLTTSTVAIGGAGDLYPGQTDGDLHVTINNPNPYPVTVTEISPQGDPVESDTVDCEPGNHLVWLDILPTTVDIDIAAGGSTTTVVEDVVNMDTDSANECQGAVFTIPITVSGENTV